MKGDLYNGGRSSELLQVTVFSPETPHQRLVNLLGSKEHDLSFLCVLSGISDPPRIENEHTSIISNRFYASSLLIFKETEKLRHLSSFRDRPSLLKHQDR